MDCRQPGFSVHGIVHASVLEWVVMPCSRGSSQPRDWTQVSCIADRFFTTEPSGKLGFLARPWQKGIALKVDPYFSWTLHATMRPSFQSCLTLCDPMDCSPPGCSVHGILQARILEWVAIPFSRGSFLTQRSNPGVLHCRQILYSLSHQGSLYFHFQRAVEEANHSSSGKWASREQTWGERKGIRQKVEKNSRGSCWFDSWSKEQGKTQNHFHQRLCFLWGCAWTGAIPSGFQEPVNSLKLC